MEVDEETDMASVVWPTRFGRVYVLKSSANQANWDFVSSYYGLGQTISQTVAPIERAASGGHLPRRFRSSWRRTLS